MNEKFYMMTRLLLLWGILLVGIGAQLSAQQTEQLIHLKAAEQRSVTEAPELLRRHFQPSDVPVQFELRQQTEEPALGVEHRTYQARYAGLPVAFGEYRVHSKAGKVYSLGGANLAQDRIDTRPSLSAATCFERLLEYVQAEHYLWEAPEDDPFRAGYEQPKGELQVLPIIPGVTQRPQLVYKYAIYATEPLEVADYYVSAVDGRVVFQNDRLCGTDLPGSGTAHYEGPVNFRAELFLGSYRLRNKVITNGTLTTRAYSGQNGSTVALSDITSMSTSFNHPIGVQAHWSGEQTIQYYQQIHNRDSYNGNGAPVQLVVGYTPSPNNAFWDGTRAFFGNGDGTNYNPLVSLDIVGHELTHGVIQTSADLVYSYESGALNESFADIFGECIEYHVRGNNDWLIGAEARIGSGAAIRSMSNPNTFSHPDTYLGTHWYTGPFDNGGVHFNSGVQNHWFYLLVNGGTGTTDFGAAYAVNGIGLEKAEQIAYRNLTVYLTPLSNYADARAGAIQSARDLYGSGSAEEIAVTNAWHAVGLGTPYGVASNEVCAQDSVTLTIGLDNNPAKIAWNIQSLSTGGFLGMAGLGAYSANQAGDTITVTTPVTQTGYYKFNLYDFGLNGLCCEDGSGFFTLTSGMDTLARGGLFDLSINKRFCVNAGAGNPGDTIRPTTPQGLYATNITSDATTVTWQPATDNQLLFAYYVFLNDSLYTQYGLGDTTISLINLQPSTTYEVQVFAMDQYYNFSEAGTPLLVNTLAIIDTIPPNAPTGLLVSNIREDGFDLQWQSVIESGGIQEYRVLLNGAQYGSLLDTIATVNGLLPNTAYQIQVVAVDSSGNVSLPSSPASATTLPRSNNCGVGPLTLSLTFDNHPEEVYWEIRNASGQVQASSLYSQAYASEPPSSTKLIALPSLPAGDYVLIVTDSGGDGLCCGSGNGQVVLSDGNGSLLVTSTYQYSRIQAFCVGSSNGDTFDLQPPTAPQSLMASNLTPNSVRLSWGAASDNEGIYLYGVFMDGDYLALTAQTEMTIPILQPGTTYDFFIIARDQIGNFSAPSNSVTITTPYGVSETLLHEGYFETGWDGWIDGGNDCRRISNNKVYEGDYAIRIRDNSGLSSSMTSPAFDLSPYDSVQVAFHYFARSMEPGEDFWLRYKNGSGNWDIIASYTSGVEFTGNGFYTDTLMLPASQFNLGETTQFRFQCDATDNQDQIFIDAVVITGYSSGPSSNLRGQKDRQDWSFFGRATPPVAPSLSLGVSPMRTDSQLPYLYPNPSRTTFSLGGVAADAVEALTIYDSHGRNVWTSSRVNNLNIHNLKAGIYTVVVRKGNGQSTTLRLMKLD